MLRRATDTLELLFHVSQICNDQSSVRCKVSRVILLPKSNQSVTLTLSRNRKTWMQHKELSVSSHWVQLNWTNHSTDSKNSLSGIQKNPKTTTSRMTLKKLFLQFRQQANDRKATRRKGKTQLLWERIPKKPEQPFDPNWNLDTSSVSQARRRSEHKEWISWIALILELHFRGPPATTVSAAYVVERSKDGGDSSCTDILEYVR